jgi:hemerythrin-like domain-containing protein
MTAHTSQQDVVALLQEQHHQIKQMLSRLQVTDGAARQDLFEELVRFLAVHEAAEEIVVHPVARDADERVVTQRLEEEGQAKHALNELYDLGTDHPDFPAKLSTAAAAIIQHAEREEAEEFPLLRQNNSPVKLEQMAQALLAAQAMAPTRPHPAVGESATVNLFAGPPLAIFDRIRDALHSSSTGRARS